MPNLRAMSCKISRNPFVGIVLKISDLVQLHICFIFEILINHTKIFAEAINPFRLEQYCT